MNRSEAGAVLMERFHAELGAKTVQYIKDETTAAEFTFADFGIKMDFGELLDAAFNYSYLRNFSIRLSRLMGRAHEIDDPIAHTFDGERMQAVMAQLSQKLDQPPKNASFARENGEFVIHKEEAGYGIDIESAARHTQEVLASFASGSVELSIKTAKPQYTVADVEFAKSALGAYSTPVENDDDPRLRNIRLAASRINNQMLYPGQVFSAGTHIKANVPDSGYEAATVLVRGQPVSDIGGGVCQVVTTLYNAVLRAELEIVQRHNHSARVSYAELGFDATIAGNYYDLKFKNNTDRPILITGHVANNSLHVEIIGHETRPPERAIHFATKKVDAAPPAPYREVVDAAIPMGQRQITQESQMGYQVDLYKVIYINNQEAERVKVNTSIYKPLQGIVAIGAG